MQISFFEEFPSKKNLEKLKLITWTTKVYLAAKSVKEFEKLKRTCQRFPRVKECIYWPVLEKKEGYWISPFSKKEALQRIFSELKDKKIPVMIDTELPTRHNPLLYFTQSKNFSINKSSIQDFIVRYRGDIYIAQYYPLHSFLMRVLNLDFDPRKFKYKTIKMLYRSLRRFSDYFFIRELREEKKTRGDNFIPALGLLAPGIPLQEPVLTAEELEHDLALAKKEDMEEVIIFRLSGVTKEIVKVIEKYQRLLQK